MITSLTWCFVQLGSRLLFLVVLAVRGLALHRDTVLRRTVLTTTRMRLVYRVRVILLWLTSTVVVLVSLAAQHTRSSARAQLTLRSKRGGKNGRSSCCKQST